MVASNNRADFSLVEGDRVGKIYRHPVSAIFPEMTQKELEELAEDIKKNGLHEPIITHPQGGIIDGWNRYRACLIAGVAPWFDGWIKNDAAVIKFVIGKNLHRRHLDDSQRAMVAARLSNYAHGGDRSKLPNGNLLKRERTAKLLGVSKRATDRAAKILREGTPDLIKAVDDRNVKVSTAAVLSELPKEKQNEVVTAGKQEASRAAGELRKQKRTLRKKAKKIIKAEPSRWSLKEANEKLSPHCFDLIVADLTIDKDKKDKAIELAEEAAKFLKPSRLLAIAVTGPMVKTIVDAVQPHVEYRDMVVSVKGKTCTPVLLFATGEIEKSESQVIILNEEGESIVDGVLNQLAKPLYATWVPSLSADTFEPTVSEENDTTDKTNSNVTEKVEDVEQNLEMAISTKSNVHMTRALRDLIIPVLTKKEWGRTVFEGLAGAVALPIEKALESANTIAMDSLGEKVFTGDDPIVVNKEVAETLLDVPIEDSDNSVETHESDANDTSPSDKPAEVEI